MEQRFDGFLELALFEQQGSTHLQCRSVIWGKHQCLGYISFHLGNIVACQIAIRNIGQHSRIFRIYLLGLLEVVQGVLVIGDMDEQHTGIVVGVRGRGNHTGCYRTLYHLSRYQIHFGTGQGIATDGIHIRQGFFITHLFYLLVDFLESQPYTFVCYVQVDSWASGCRSALEIC